MKTTTILVKVTNAERKNLSVNGNPSWWVEYLTLGSAESFKGCTASDAMCGYIAGGMVGDVVLMTYHTTRSGNVIIDYMEYPQKRYIGFGACRVCSQTDDLGTATLHAIFDDTLTYDSKTGEVLGLHTVDGVMQLTA